MVVKSHQFVPSLLAYGEMERAQEWAAERRAKAAETVASVVMTAGDYAALQAERRARWHAWRAAERQARRPSTTRGG